VEIFGTVTNQGEAIVTAGTVVVSTFDETGGLLATETAELGSVAIPPGGKTDFRVAFHGLGYFTDVRFAVSSRGYRVLEKAPQAGVEEPEPEPEPEG
ncbi:MAG TPA: FxLYD domain-containing protein, partial [Thermoanaerobaculia bacterium]|nr:FxLYD domain-containing protein [Thermoanaerobaculia bacterium]